MRFCFKTRRLAALYDSEVGASAYPEAVVDAFFEVMAVIAAAMDERDLYALKSLHFEKLKRQADPPGQRSLRLNDQYRLILTIEQDGDGRYCYLIEINKHYR